jgi:hypothetical protein
MMGDILSLNWTAQALTGEQLLVLRNVAAKQLRMRKHAGVVNFKHPLCEGEMTRKQEGVFGAVAGTFFHADLGLVAGERWTVDFMLPRTSEWTPVDDKTVVVGMKPLPGGDYGTKAINVAGTIVT